MADHTRIRLRQTTAKVSPLREVRISIRVQWHFYTPQKPVTVADRPPLFFRHLPRGETPAFLLSTVPGGGGEEEI